MRRTFALSCGLALATMLVASIAQADQRSDNMRRLAQVPILMSKDDPKTDDKDETAYAKGSDLAFQKNRVIAGSWEGIGVFKIFDKAPFLKQQSFAYCPGAQGDVSVFGDLVFMSVDTPQIKTDDSKTNGECDTKDASRLQYTPGDNNTWEGVRIFSIADPARPPQLVGAVKAACGSHTHTLVPSGKKLYLYVHSYPLASGVGVECNHANHSKNYIYEVDTDDPAKTQKRLVGSVDVSPAVGCHDVTAVPEKDIAIAACITEGQIWDISDPAKPEVLSRIRKPYMIFHSSAMTWDGKIAVLGDEFAGAAAGAGCVSPDGQLGAMWFYDITDPRAPKEAGHWGPPRTAFPTTAASAAKHSCTTHNFSVLPMKDPKKYIATTSYYSAGISMVDFSDPANPKEIAYYVPEYEGGEQPDTWAAYWYNGRVYTNDLNLPRADKSLPSTPSTGLGVYQVKGYDTNKRVEYYRQRFNPQVQIYDFR